LTSVAIGKTGRLNGRLSSDRRVFDPSPPFSLRYRSGDRFKILYHLTDGNSKLAIIDDAGAVLVLPTAHVPHIWPLEVTNALVKAPRRKHITQYELFDYARQLARLRAPVDFDCTLERAFHELLTLAERRQLTTYNAAYPELAQRRGLPLATADGNLLQAAGATRVEVFKP
jgi:predicted nucleic acid-binding protein